MTLRAYGQQIEVAVFSMHCLAPDHTPLGKAGRVVHAMVHAYAKDGSLFLSQGDMVNALAAFGYAEGWLEGGAFLGLVNATPTRQSGGAFEQLQDPHLQPRLDEKVHRYHRLLGEAIQAIEPAPDEASILWKGCEEIQDRSASSLRQGVERCQEGKRWDALWWFAYGHGWLDAGVRTGLFRIVGRRDLFTV
jgi:Uncharacterized protein conserved in archaea